MSKVESADLILKLYDLRREKVMREARNWIQTYTPESAEEIGQTMMDPEVGGYLRMVTSYWDMAASFVNHGAIDADMFNDITGEHIMVFAKIEPHLAGMREMWGEPDLYKHLEKVIMDREDGAESVKKMQEWMAMSEEQATEGEKTEAATQ